jgi:ubiquinone/menaquinone biosynthesis C-methylase UbiE
MKMTNRRNLAVYRVWAPIYDATVERLFAPARRRALEVLALRPGERVLLLGVGTGSDLPLLPEGTRALGIDLSEAMLARARAKLPLPGRTVELALGDAQDPAVEPGSFDAVILNLILSVVPDGAACLRAALRAVAPGGRIVVFDKFAPEGARVPPRMRLLNQGSTLFGTDVTRRFGDLARGSGCEIVHDEASLLGGMYRILLLRRAA